MKLWKGGVAGCWSEGKNKKLPKSWEQMFHKEPFTVIIIHIIAIVFTIAIATITIIMMILMMRRYRGEAQWGKLVLRTCYQAAAQAQILSFVIIILSIIILIIIIIILSIITITTMVCSLFNYRCFVLINILNITFHTSTAHKSPAYLAGKFNNPLFHICNLRIQFTRYGPPLPRLYLSASMCPPKT